MSVLVTGASGFVGSAVARQLLARGARVRLLVRPNADRRNLAGLDADIVTGDLNDPASLKAACQGIGTLYHVAADYRIFTRDPAGMLRTNVDGSVNLIRAAADAGCGRMVYTSSVAAIKPHADGSPANEESPSFESDMIGIYKLSKFKAEQAVLDLARREDLDVVVVNPSTPIGPRDVKPTPTGRIVIECAMGRMPAYVDTGLNIAHVDDVAHGHLLAFDRGRRHERYILGGQDMTLGEILAEISHLVGRKPPRVKIPTWPILPFAYAAEALARKGMIDEPFATVDGIKMARKKMYFSHIKATQELGYRPRPARDALADAVSWCRDNGYFR